MVRMPTPPPPGGIGPTRSRKADLRGRIRQSRADLHERLGTTGWDDRAERLAATVLRDPDVAAACAGGHAVAAFASTADEPPTGPLLDALRAAGARVLLPVVMPDRVLAWAAFTGHDTLEPDSFGIPTPADPHLGLGAQALTTNGARVVLVPALAVDRGGRRLGQGGGYYDVLLEALPPHADGGPVTVALVGADEVLPAGAVPVADHDTPVDRVITG